MLGKVVMTWWQESLGATYCNGQFTSLTMCQHMETNFHILAFDDSSDTPGLLTQVSCSGELSPTNCKI